MAAPQVQVVRRWIMTLAVAGITVTGTIYGAGLRSDQTARSARKRYEQTPPEEIISQLQLARQDLVVKRNEMERKIAGLHESMRLAKLEKEKLARETDEERQAREREEDTKLMTKLLRPR